MHIRDIDTEKEKKTKKGRERKINGGRKKAKEREKKRGRERKRIIWRGRDRESDIRNEEAKDDATFARNSKPI